MPRRTTPDPLCSRVGARIRELRNEYDMSLEQLADASKLSKGHLSSVEQGLVAITLGTIASIARGFGLPALYVVAFAEEDPGAEVVELIRKLRPEQFRPLYRELKKSAKATKASKAAR